MVGKTGLKLTNDYDPPAPMEENAAQGAFNLDGTSLRLITGSPTIQPVLKFRANKLDNGYQVLMDAANDFLKSSSSKPKHHQNWEELIDDVLDK